MNAEPVQAADLEVVIPHFKRRFSGVTASVIALVPALARHFPTVTVGFGIPERVPRVSWLQLWRTLRRGPRTIWQARRNSEMLIGLFLKYVLRFRLTLIWLSADNYRRQWFTRLLYRRMDVLITTSERAATFIDAPSIVVPHGIDTHRFHPPRDRRISWKEKRLPGEFGLGIFGRVRPNKGTGDLVQALCEVLPAHPDWTAIIVGETTPRYRHFQRTLQRQVAQAQLSDRIVFVGKVDNFDEIPGWYRAVSLVVAPPWLEGFGLTIPEAMASGCAVIATDTGVFPQLIETDRDGWLIPCRNQTALATALRAAMTCPERLEAMGQRARRTIESRFPLEREAERLAAVYRERSVSRA